MHWYARLAWLLLKGEDRDNCVRWVVRRSRVPREVAPLELDKLCEGEWQEEHDARCGEQKSGVRRASLSREVACTQGGWKPARYEKVFRQCRGKAVAEVTNTSDGRARRDTLQLSSSRSRAGSRPLHAIACTL